MAGRSERERRIRAQREDLRREIARVVHMARLDTNASSAEVARAANLSSGHMSEVESGQADPSLDALVAIAAALGKRLTVQLIPDRDPLVTDHRQAPMVEELLRRLDTHWTSAVEVPVYRPVHGVIDVVLTHRESQVVVCLEVQSQIRRLEQQIRWAGQKADALLASGPIRGASATTPSVFRLLALASTARNREVVREFKATIMAAYPASPERIVGSLTANDPWPGSGLVWLSVHGRSARLLPGWPRGFATDGTSGRGHSTWPNDS